MPTQVRGAKTPEGEFIRAAGCQWVTSNGYTDVVTASGKHLGRFPSEKILEAFRALPEEDRRPGGGNIPDLAPGESSVPTPPPNGLVLRVHTRAMTKGEKGSYREVAIGDYPLVKGDAKRFEELKGTGNFGPNVDTMWLTEAEWRSLVPADPVVGQQLDAAPAVVERLARFHLVPHKMVGGTGHWGKKELGTARLTLTVEDVTEARVRLRADGFAQLGSAYDAENATTPDGPLRRGYEAPLHGFLEVDRRTRRFTRFELVAPGEVWGRWGDANNKSLPVERPGRNPVLIAFELATGDSPTDRIPPGGWGHFLDLGYFGR